MPKIVLLCQLMLACNECSPSLQWHSDKNCIIMSFYISSNPVLDKIYIIFFNKIVLRSRTIMLNCS